MASGVSVQRLIALACGQELVVCGRCGWRGRQRRLPAHEQARHAARAGSGSGTNLDLSEVDAHMNSARGSGRAASVED